MAIPMSELLSIDNPVFRTYAIYTGILVLKMLAMALLTGRQRMAKKVFANPEDAKSLSKVAKVRFDDPDIERVRRAHLNDLENIPIFLVISFLYTLTNPSVTVAVNLMRAFTAGRIMHTIVYAVWVVPQPARGIAWAVGFVTTIYMAVQVIVFFCN